jgi:hypothetical protein
MSAAAAGTSCNYPGLSTDHDRCKRLYAECQGNLDRYTDRERSFIRSVLSERERLDMSDQWHVYQWKGTTGVFT